MKACIPKSSITNYWITILLQLSVTLKISCFDHLILLELFSLKRRNWAWLIHKFYSMLFAILNDFYQIISLHLWCPWQSVVLVTCWNESDWFICFLDSYMISDCALVPPEFHIRWQSFYWSHLVFNNIKFDTQMPVLFSADIWTYFIQMDYINSSNPNFLGGSKAVEIAMQQLRSSQVCSTTFGWTIYIGLDG